MTAKEPSGGPVTPLGGEFIVTLALLSIATILAVLQ
jgi:hypothetical protein